MKNDSEDLKKATLNNINFWASDKQLYNYPCDGCGKSQAQPMLSQLAFIVLCEDCAIARKKGKPYAR